MNNKVKKMYEKVQTFSDDKLIDVFERLFKSSPHKRISREFLIIAIARKIQTTMMKNTLGFVPKIITNNNVSFWSAKEVYLHKQQSKKTNLKIHMCQKDGTCNFTTESTVEQIMKNKKR
jgi:hypothetical protein